MTRRLPPGTASIPTTDGIRVRSIQVSPRSLPIRAARPIRPSTQSQRARPPLCWPTSFRTAPHSLLNRPRQPDAHFCSPASRIRAMSRQDLNFPRTPKSNYNAAFWEFAVGGRRTFQYWDQTLARLLFEYRMDSDAPRAARAYAIVWTTFHDAGVACWDAKYSYWMIRAFQADPDIKTVFPTPNHPSYPAAHGCFSTASAAVLGYLFPRDAVQLAALAEEANQSRIAAGIHYRSDTVAGRELGLAVAGKAIARAGRTDRTRRTCHSSRLLSTRSD